jgi:hypothetical protein
VEDDASFGMMIQTWLKKNGYEAVLASRFEQAKNEISNGDFGLILTDLRLPDGDGIILSFRSNQLYSIRRWTWQWAGEAFPLAPKELVDDWLERREKVNKIEL